MLENFLNYDIRFQVYTGSIYHLYVSHDKALEYDLKYLYNLIRKKVPSSYKRWSYSVLEIYFYSALNYESEEMIAEMLYKIVYLSLDKKMGSGINV